MNDPAECPPGSRDLTCGGTGVLIWVVPIVILGITAGVGGLYAAIMWPPLLLLMGTACLVNARRCSRMHCFITGPFFLLLAGASLLYGVGLLPLGLHGWEWLTDALLIGGCVLCCVPEWLFGRYIRRRPTAQ